ncbi:hypothetical protein GALMADRAFT_233056 [Galerina marginata CBS 339.88]|uniref:Cytochrome c-type biogenesis protein H TPR domain-containing protein n=1 Tax=Galerina marginata (strain CBS 339.88) TaxID=685588 RepID=A0A067TNC7_GALM3|nr:hypothetical protein GALMADRAFT_233056 [Galerina marginata CBS 339.88]
MSHRHISRQPDRDVRMHDPPQQHPHHIPHPHLNGNPIPSTPALSNGNTISPAVPTALPNGAGPSGSIIHKLNTANEQTWLLIGRVAEQMGDLEHALSAYENALRHNPTSVSGLTQVAGIARIKENYPKAVDFFQRVLQIEEDNGEIWSALGHCYLMQDDLQKAYSAYQQALYLLPNPKEDPKLWYGIGILYDRYGSLDHAEEAFASVLRMCKDLDFDKENEILFRLGIIYKQQGKFTESLECFDHILRNPPSPLAHADIWFQIGHVFEQQKNHLQAKDAYERVVEANPGHAKVLQQLGWLYHQDGSSFQNQELAIQYLTKSLEADPSDAQSWYLLGRAYMAGQKYNKAYEAYQQAVYRDGRNPTFWCSIGVLYFQINQFRDALDAYSRAIRINPYISEVWFDLGSLYESCNNQITDAIDAYARASELDPSNNAIAQRLQLLKNAQATGGQLPAAPGPQDVHPTAYASSVVPPPGLTGPPLMLQSGNHRPSFRADSRGPSNEIALPPPQSGNGRVTPPPPFRGGPPPPVILDESRHMPSHTPLAPMEVDRPPHQGGRDYPPPREHARGPVGHQSLLLQHPLPPQPSDDPRNGGHGHHQDPYYNRGGHSRSISPGPQSGRPRSPPGSFQGYPIQARQPMGPAQPSAVPPQRSPRTYHRRDPSHPEPESAWDRRPPPGDHRDWDREHDRRPRHGPGEYMQHGGPQSSFYPPRSPRAHSPPEPSPRAGHATRYWDNKPGAGPSAHPGFRPVSPPPSQQPSAHHRYDPRHDARDSREYEIERTESRSYPVSPEGMRARNMPPHIAVGNSRASESPHITPMLPEAKDGRRRRPKDREDIHPHPQPQQQQPPPPQQPQQPLPPPQFPSQSSTPSMQEPAPKKERRKRANGNKRKEEESAERQKSFAADRSNANMPVNFKSNYPKGPGSPENSSNSGSSRSIQPSPTSATPRQPSRPVDEDYDEGVADALIGLRSYRANSASGPEAPSHSPTISSHSRLSDPSPRPPPSHRNSVSSNHASPPVQPTPLKRALSPGPEDPDNNNKRSRVDIMKRRISSPSGGRRTPLPSTRPSPIPFRTQPASHSPEARGDPFPPSPSLPDPAVFPPHPRPVGAGHAQAHASSVSTSIALPPIATLSPASSAPSPANHNDEKMHVDSARSISPPSRGKLSEMIHPSSRSPTAKNSQSPPSEKKESSS